MKTLIAAVSASALLLGPTAVADPVPALPRPSGPHAVGTTALHLVDQSRQDPWVPQEKRELMVSLWYPTRDDDAPRAQYVTPEESRRILEGQQLNGVSPEIFSTTRTHAGVDAEPLDRDLPLVLLSPGFTLPRTSLTGLAEDLASRGYAVAAVDHNYEARAITFPDGRVTGCLACEQTPKPDGATVAGNRAADLSFVLDELIERGGIDGDRVVVAGHSMGGASAARALLADDRFRAAANLDGTFHPGLTADSDRPLLMLGADRHGRPGADETWDGTWSHLTGWKRWFSVEGSSHWSFTDYSPLAEQVGIDLGPEPIAGDRAARITADYLDAFADFHLRGVPQPLLDGPSPRYPEVRFENP
ncbi:Platelet-activating factor acetylhydrolase, isoform II [Saccharopolyspora antimicrobica]|uniref:Platelet-activating factor acetylhydrolase isoform II n=1 Tax=Saccharopolyspora antimicrobica TaxID=455193 RepID=A0A1I4WYV6_9PSEU|nr:prolyl oligopeptidase family serine peptidase [Saccharopolyspora antimicrobica]RKT84199.1 platelet-activating factor acetylhydrolase isoform II [Saccharopolyspora antimicrobica]SFN18316.1 Platelet-activating factor acetylhydrolase, isoform II [Saccharopolyspora antimicrobica]